MMRVYPLAAILSRHLDYERFDRFRPRSAGPAGPVPSYLRAISFRCQARRFPGADDGCECRQSASAGVPSSAACRWRIDNLCRYWSLVQPSTMPPPPVRIKTYRCGSVSRFWHASVQSGMRSIAVIVLLKLNSFVSRSGVVQNKVWSRMRSCGRSRSTNGCDSGT